MSETAFAALCPRNLVGGVGTEFAVLRPRRIRTGPLRILRKLDDLTDLLSVALEEPLELTPLSAGPEWLSGPRRVGDQRDEPSPALRTRSLAALAELRSTLSISDTAAARLVGVARNTLASWRSGARAPYPATVRRLFEVQSVVAAARALLGEAEAGAWFHGRLGTESRIQLLATDEGLQRLAAELRARLFAGVRVRTLPEIDELTDETAAAKDVGFHPELYIGPIVRRPKVD
ncbi:MAG: hypothetical protein M3P85_04235 [Actinomycetota bacterium]|nr:hypothetical protein [Actinomycetota bacterium]